MRNPRRYVPFLLAICLFVGVKCERDSPELSYRRLARARPSAVVGNGLERDEEAGGPHPGSIEARGE
jgi:hypothetical protein